MIKLILISLLALAEVIFGVEIECKVQYVSATTVYLDIGRSAGIAQGDTVVISRDNRELIRLNVSFVADKSSSCELVNAPALILVNDHATVFATTTPEIVPSATIIEEPKLVERETQKTRGLPVNRINQLSGRIGVDYTIQNDHEPVNYDYTEPGLSFRATLSKISGSDFSARTNLRLRRTIRENDALSSSSNRIYEAMLAYEPEDNPFSGGIGRLMLRETRGMGYLDGAYVKYDIARNWKIGAVGGIEPDLQNTRIQSDVTKVGAFAAFEQRLTESSSLQATASLAGRYLEGEVSREFLYQQLSYLHGARFRFFESAEINFNRDWLKDAEGSTVTLASVLLDARYSVTRALGMNISYDNRTNYYTAETRSIPDSIFESSLQQGFRASIDSRFAKSYSAELGIGVRDGKSSTAKASSGWFRVGSNNVFDSQTSVYGRLRWFDSNYSRGTQPSVKISREMTDWLSSGIEFGANNYELSATTEKIAQTWLSLMLDLRFAKAFYASTEIEHNMGEGHESTIVNLSLGYRF